MTRPCRTVVFRQWWTPAGTLRPDPETDPFRNAQALTVTWHADCVTCGESLGEHPTETAAQAVAQHHKEMHR